MKKHYYIGRICVLTLILVAVLAAVGCGAMGEEETPEITVSYLEGDYAQQLMNDGAEKLLGSMELNKGESGDIEMILHPKELVADDTQPGGYRIDSYALNRTFTVSEQAYATFIASDSDGQVQILTPDKLCTAISEEYESLNTSFVEYGDRQLYDVYALDNQVLLILTHQIEE